MYANFQVDVYFALVIEQTCFSAPPRPETLCF